MASWRRTHIAVWFSLFATSMGLMAILPVLALYVGERFGISDPDELTWWSGLIYGVAPLCAAVCGPFWGALGDRVGKKPMAIRANLAIALSTAFMPLCETPALLLVLRALQGMFAGYIAPAMALVTQNAPPEQQGRTIGGLQVAMALGLFGGPVLGAQLTVAFDRTALFWFTSGITLVAAAILWLFAVEAPRAPDEPDRPRPSFGRDLRQQLGRLLHNRVFVTLLALIFVLRLGQNMLEPFIALFVTELGAPGWMRQALASPRAALELLISASFTVLALAQMVFSPLWGRASDRLGPLRCLALVAFGLGVVQLVTAAVATAEGFLLLRALAACFMAGSMTLAYAAASKRVAPERRTLAYSLVQSCMQFGFAFGPIAGGRIAAIGASAEHANLRLVFVVAGALCLVAGASMLALRRAGVRNAGSTAT